MTTAVRSSARLRSVVLLLAAALVAATFLAPSAEAAFPGSNGRIVFERAGKIASATAAGGSITTLAKGRNSKPSWSPDGRWITYLRKAPEYHDWQVMVMRADGSGKRKVAGPGLIDDTTWAPNGTVLYSEFDMAAGTSRWMSVKRDGTGRKRVLGALKGTITRARWSPDGSRLAISYSPKGEPEYPLYTVKPDGSGLRKLTAKTAGDFDWHPNGKVIAYQSEYEDLYRINADGSGNRRLADGSPEKQFKNPAWSPNGKRIAYAYQAGANSDIFTMAPDGSNKTRLIGGAALDGSPSWQPK